MLDYLLNDLLNELDLHFRMQDIFKQSNKSPFGHMDIKRYDLYSNYMFYCNLHDIKIDRKHFNSLLDLVTTTLSHKGYETYYNTDTNMLEVNRRV